MNKPETEKKSKTPAHSRLKNLAVWFLCFIAAFALWNSLNAEEKNSSKSVTQTYSISVRLFNQDKLEEKGLCLLSYADNTSVKVTLSGKEKNMPKGDGTDAFRAMADLSAVTEDGDISSPVVVEPPEGCEVYSLSPSEIEVSIDSNANTTLSFSSAV